MSKASHFFAAALVGAATAGLVQAQDGGTQANLNLSPGLFYEDDTTRARLGFGASYDSVTSNQRFSLGLDGALDSGYDDITDALRTPQLSLSYGLESRATALDATFSYRRAQIDALVFDDDLDSDFLVLGTGERADLAASTSLTFGRETPFGGRLDLGYRQERYLDTVDPTLLDEDTRSAGLSLRFDIDRRISLTLAGQFSDTDVDGFGTDQERRSLNAGLDLAVSQSLNASVSLGGSRITQTGVSGTTVTEGVTATASATQDLPNGSLSGTISSDVTTAGRRTTLRADRSLELPRGSLSFGAGIGQIENGDLQTLARLSWRNEGPRAQYDITLDRALAVNNDGDRAVNTQFGLSWQQDLDRLSSFGVGLSLRDTDRLDAGPDSTQTSLSLTFRRDLTQDWGVRSTYTQRWSQETGAPDTNNSTIFLGLERGFQWRP